jgi:hypothetical protein
MQKKLLKSVAKISERCVVSTAGWYPCIVWTYRPCAPKEVSSFISERLEHNIKGQ